MEWFRTTLQTYPELAILLSLAIGYWVGGKTFKGFSLGAVTGTLLAAIVIGQLGINVSGPVKSLFFLLFLFAVGYGIGPQFVKGLAKDGLPQAGFAVVQCLFSLAFVVIAAKIARYDLGTSAGLFAGSQTISAAMGLSTDAINRLGMAAAETQQRLAAMPVAYAVTYIFGTIGSAVLLAQVLPRVMHINLAEASKDYEIKHGGKQDEEADSSQETAWHEYELRTYQLSPENSLAGKTVQEFEAGFAQNRVFVEGLRQDGKVVEPTSSTVLKAGDVIAVGGEQKAVLQAFAQNVLFREVADEELIRQPYSGVDVYVTHKDADGKTLKDLNAMASEHGVFLRRIRRGLTAVDIPLLPNTQLHRGDVITLIGLSKDVQRAAKSLGVIDRRTTVTDVATMAAALVVGALIGAVVVRVHGVPITLSTAGGALIAGLVFGWLRSVKPLFGYIPQATVWFMNSVGLNVFIAVVGLSAGPSFVQGLKAQGISLFLWGIAVTSLPLICGAFAGRYIFKFHPAILFGVCAGARTTTAALGMINEQAKSNIPSLGYTVTYAVGNTLLTMWGLVIIMLMS